jgi:hypothetical protein
MPYSIPRTPETDRERQYHEAYWGLMEDRARIGRIVATAITKIELGNPSGAKTDLETV